MERSRTTIEQVFPYFVTSINNDLRNQHIQFAINCLARDIATYLTHARLKF